MFAKIAVSCSTLAILASAVPTGFPSQCNNGHAQCCNSVQKASDPSYSTLLGLLGIVAGPVDALVGVGCTPITAVGVGSGPDCAQQSVCCQDNYFGGLVNVGCNPFKV